MRPSTPSVLLLASVLLACAGEPSRTVTYTAEGNGRTVIHYLDNKGNWQLATDGERKTVALPWSLTLIMGSSQFKAKIEATCPFDLLELMLPWKEPMQCDVIKVQIASGGGVVVEETEPDMLDGYQNLDAEMTCSLQDGQPDQQICEDDEPFWD